MDTKGRRKLAKKIITPSELNLPAYLMNFPFTVDNKYRNNVLMKPDHQPYDYDRAFSQWMSLYNAIVDEGGLVYILPSEREFQDLPYVANIGCYLPHIKDPTVLVSNFYSPPRIGEEILGVRFFQSMRYNARMCPTYWEGEADLKWLHNNVYAAPYGIRTEKASHDWFRYEFDMEVVSIKMNDEKLYHLDCMLFPLDDNRTVVATSIMDKEDIKNLEKVTEIIDIPKEYIYNGWTNSVRIGNKIFHAWDHSNKEIDKFYGNLGFYTVPILLDEFDKSGADLSCLIMHLNYIR